MTDAGADGSGYAVVDASVCLKWALDDEELVEQAVAIRDAGIAGSFQMVAPSLWVYEIVNGLVSGVRRGRTTADIGITALGAMLAIGVRLVDPDPSHVFEMSVRLGIAAYDAAYVALAEALGCPCWTADDSLRRACASDARVRFLGDFRTEETLG